MATANRWPARSRARIGRIRGHGKDEGREDVDIEKKSADEDPDGADAGKKGAAPRNGQHAENEEIEEVGEKDIPLKNGGDADRNKRVHHEEEMMIDLHPVGGAVLEVPGGAWWIR